MRALAATESGRYASFEVDPWIWAVFVAFVTVLLVADLLLVHRRPHAISFKEAAIESAAWIALGTSFTLFVVIWHGGQAGGEYLAAYLIEKSLSIDNVFVWAVILSYFKVPAQFQFRVLFWGVFGALVLRAAFIFAGVALIESFDWILYVFGVFLLFTAVRVARHGDTEVHPDSNLALRLVRKLVPSTDDYDGQKLFTKRNGKRLATPLFAVLVLIETTDVVFAVDSIPAILAVSRVQFIVFSSNAFAILGLRALYFLLAGMADRFRYLNVGLGVVLGFVGVKMLASDVYHLPVWISLVVIIAVLGVAIVASLRAESREGGGSGAGSGGEPSGEPHGDAGGEAAAREVEAETAASGPSGGAGQG